MSDNDDENLNETVWKGEVDGTLYEIDLLKDSNFGDDVFTYQVFDGDGDKARHLGADVLRPHHSKLPNSEYPQMVREALA